LPPWTGVDFVDHTVAEFQRTSFHCGLNYYQAAKLYLKLSPAFKGPKTTQPSLRMMGKADGLEQLYPLTEDQLRVGFPGLLGFLELDNIGRWWKTKRLTSSVINSSNSYTSRIIHDWIRFAGALMLTPLRVIETWQARGNSNP
jgi:hypothetical protein